MEIEWGAKILADGKRPEWLNDDDQRINFCDVNGNWYGEPIQWTVREIIDEDWNIFRLPADHPYYLATSKGFKYWPGGDSAPDDWDGGEVLLDSPVGTMPRPRLDRQWTNDPGPYRRVIGYKPRANSDKYTMELKVDASEMRECLAGFKQEYTVTLSDGITITGPDLTHILACIRADT